LEYVPRGRLRRIALQHSLLSLQIPGEARAKWKLALAADCPDQPFLLPVFLDETP
jgi:hypothetical protein